MSYKSVLLHVEPTEEARERLRVAIGVAKSFEGRVIGVGARALNPMPDPIGLSIAKLRQEIGEGLVSAENFFRETISAQGISYV